MDVLADVAMVDGMVPLLPSSACLLLRLLDNDATVFIVVVVGVLILVLCTSDCG